MSIKCLMDGLEVNYPCSPVCAFFGDCVTAFEAQKNENVRTNADRIRAMSDEELADWFARVTLACARDVGVVRCELDATFKKDALEWLKQPAESEEQ